MSAEESRIDHGSAIWEEIKKDKRLMETKECLDKRIGTPSAPSVVVQLLFGIVCVGIGALFLLFVFHTFGPGTYTSDVSQGNIMDDLENKTMCLLSKAISGNRTAHNCIAYHSLIWKCCIFHLFL